MVLCASRSETAERAVSQLKAELPEARVWGIWPSLEDPEQVRTAFDRIGAEHGRIDIPVNNAGVSESTPFGAYTGELFDRVMDLNVKGMFHCARGAVPWMERQGRGVILNTSSMVSFYGQPAGVAYPVSKFAVNGFTPVPGPGAGAEGDTGQCGGPGHHRDGHAAGSAAGGAGSSGGPDPLGRVGQPGEVAEAFVFLASEQASYITGVVPPGGRTGPGLNSAGLRPLSPRGTGDVQLLAVFGHGTAGDGGSPAPSAGCIASGRREAWCCPPPESGGGAVPWRHSCRPRHRSPRRPGGRENDGGERPPGTLDIFVPNGAADRGFMDLQLLGDVGQAQGPQGAGPRSEEVLLAAGDSLGTPEKRGLPLTNGPEHVFGLAELQGKIFPHLGVIGLGQETAVIGVDLEVGTVTVPQAGSEMSVHLFDQNIRLNIGDLAGEREDGTGTGIQLSDQPFGGADLLLRDGETGGDGMIMFLASSSRQSRTMARAGPSSWMRSNWKLQTLGEGGSPHTCGFQGAQ